MPQRKQRILPSRVGFCKSCGKDRYPDTISAALALEALSKRPPRGADGPVRFYRCPHSQPGSPVFHLTSQHEIREMKHSV